MSPKWGRYPKYPSNYRYIPSLRFRLCLCSHPKRNVTSKLCRWLTWNHKIYFLTIKCATTPNRLSPTRFALLSRRAHERVAVIILRSSFKSIRPWRLCTLTPRFLNSPLVVYSFITPRTIPTAYNITTESICSKSMQHTELIPAFGGSFGSDTFLTQFSELLCAVSR